MGSSIYSFVVLVLAFLDQEQSEQSEGSHDSHVPAHTGNAELGGDQLQALDDVDSQTGGGIGVFGDVELLEYLVIGVGVVGKGTNHQCRHVIAGGDRCATAAPSISTASAPVSRMTSSTFWGVSTK